MQLGITENFTMSAPLIVSIPHSLGREEAMRRLKAGLIARGVAACRC